VALDTRCLFATSVRLRPARRSRTTADPSTLSGARPILRPSNLARRIPALTRSTIKLRSSSAMAPTITTIARPNAPPVSIFSLRLINSIPGADPRDCSLRRSCRGLWCSGSRHHLRRLRLQIWRFAKPMCIGGRYRNHLGDYTVNQAPEGQGLRRRLLRVIITANYGPRCRNTSRSLRNPQSAGCGRDGGSVSRAGHAAGTHRCYQDSAGEYFRGPGGEAKI
jgi:hypothetical protein